MSKSSQLSRRQFLRLSATAGAAGLFAACAAPPAPAPTTAPTAAAVAPTAAAIAPTAAAVAPTAAAAAPAAYKEAPMLAKLVQAGSLPAVAERLPKNPLVVQVLDQIGVYGGEWTMGMEEDDSVTLLKSILYDGLVRWNLEWTAVEPNLAESWEVEDGGAKYTFKLREGVKWSDGTPFTSADILFWAETIRGNEELNGNFPGWMEISVDGEDVGPTVTAPDATTIVFEWPAPNGLFLQRLAIPGGLELTHYQAEYAKKFLPEFNPDLEKDVAAAGLSGWVDLWENKVAFTLSGINSRNQNPELPTLTAWVLKNRLGDGQVLNAERNPYYWKVDADGQQLPYIDTVRYSIVSDREVLLLSALNGEIGLQDRRISDLRNKPVLADGRDKGGFRFFDTNSASMNTNVISLNLTHKDPVKREIFNNKLFRQALSVAINRQEIIDLVFVSQGQPWQAAPQPGSVFADEEMGTQFTTYDMAQAEAWLDEAGYAKGADGKRTGPDGKPIEFVLLADRKRDGMDQAIASWSSLGITAVFSEVERTLFRQRTRANEHDATVWSGNGGNGFDIILEPAFYMPFNQESHFGMAWWLWVDDPEGEGAEEPPAPVQEQIKLYKQLGGTADEAEQARLMKEILRIAKEQFFVMGISLPAPSFGIVKNSYGNVPDTMFDAYNWPQPAAAKPEQFFIREA
ncbi:MAG: ABC transporter substrate-binding protein [Chloroflexaceae bacterium]|nr:ABC transporter substrate-binding protein [Chloroflexaceae bacterium]